MSKVQVRIHPSQAAMSAAWALDQSEQGRLCAVSDPCVVKALLDLAKERGVKVEFVALGEKMETVPLDLAGVKRVLDGGAAREEGEL